VVSRHFDDLDAVLEFDALDDFWQLIFALQSSPRFRSGNDQFEYHELGGLRRQGSLCPHGSMPHRREHALDWIWLRQRCRWEPEDELDWKAGVLWPKMASSIEPAEIEAETFLARQPDLDSFARRSATALRRRDAVLRHIEQRRSRKTKEEAQSQKIAATRSMNGKGEGPLLEPTALEGLPIAADRSRQNGHG
jgi:hypothetical protein